eukprot:7924467-Alexandrium_andersonii.AAC.1
MIPAAAALRLGLPQRLHGRLPRARGPTKRPRRRRTMLGPAPAGARPALRQTGRSAELVGFGGCAC